MASTVSQLIEGQTVICAQRQETVQTALTRMFEKDFSQLPVIDENGHLLGLLSEKSIVRATFFLNGSINVLKLTVDNCLAKAVTITPDAEVFDAQTRLKEAPALVVVEDKKPIGVLTYYDTTRFFSNVGEGLMYVEDVETGLRSYIEAVLDTKMKLDAALFHAFGTDKRDLTQPRVQYEDMDFAEHIQLITQEKNWAAFESYFHDPNLLRRATDGVREIRNQLVHFRGRLTPLQREALLQARDWLDARPRPAAKQVTATDNVTVAESINVRLEPSDVSAGVDAQLGPVVAVARGTVRFTALQAWLLKRPAGFSTVEPNFRQLEEALGSELPESARLHASWWTNDAANYPQSRSWLTVGWRTTRVDLDGETVTFERSHDALYQPFFVDLLARVKQNQPGLASGISAGMRSWLDFASGKPGFRLGWSFTRDRTFRVELNIYTGDKDRNKALFNSLERKREKIEVEFGSLLKWEPLAHRQSSRVGTETPGSISDSAAHLSELIDWGSETMIRFANTLQPYIEQLPNE